MLIIVYILLSLLSIFFNIKHKYAEMYTCLTLIYTGMSGFGLLLGNSSIKEMDFLLLALFSILFIEYYKNRDLFNIKGDYVGATVLACFLWTFIVFLFTFLGGVETFSYAFRCYRPFFVLPFYFVFRQLTINDVKKYIRCMFFISLFQGVFFYLQLVGVTGILAGYGSMLEDGENILDHRFGNYPFLSSFFFIFYFFKTDISSFKKYILLLFFGMMPIIGQMRGSIISIGIVIVLYMMICRGFMSVKQYIFIFVAIMYVVVPMFGKRDEGKDVGTFEEIKIVLTDPTKMYSEYCDERGQHFAFRIAMYIERIEYMFDHPKVCLTGVGCIHENSPRNMFNFQLGTVSKFSDGQIYVNQLSSADIAWVGILMRYGFVGVFLFTMLFAVWMKESVPFIRECNDSMFPIYALSSISSYFASYDSEVIGRVNMIYLMFMLAVVYVYKREKGLLH